MPSFPVLRTGAVAQYPLPRHTGYSTSISRFVDGSEQRSRNYPAPLRRWVIRLNLLDEGELAAVDAFFSAQVGRGGAFSFTDPADSHVYANCSLDEDSIRVSYFGPGSGGTELVIRENRT